MMGKLMGSLSLSISSTKQATPAITRLDLLRRYRFARISIYSRDDEDIYFQWLEANLIFEAICEAAKTWQTINGRLELKVTWRPYLSAIFETILNRFTFVNNILIETARIEARGVRLTYPAFVNCSNLHISPGSDGCFTAEDISNWLVLWPKTGKPKILTLGYFNGLRDLLTDLCKLLPEVGS
jgi:hypothetical protein